MTLSYMCAHIFITFLFITLGNEIMSSLIILLLHNNSI